MNRSIATAVAAISAISSIGCGDATNTAVDASPSADTAVLYSELQKLGFEDQSNTVVYNDVVMVNGDLRFERAALAAGEYTRSSAATPGVYSFHQSLVSPENVGHIQPFWSTTAGEEQPTDLIVNGVNYAVAEWNNPVETGPDGSAWDLYDDWGAIKLDWDEPTADANIIIFHVVSYFDFYNSVNSPCHANLPLNWREGVDGFVLACADFPKAGLPGRNMWIPDHLPGIANGHTCDWNQELINRVMIHELGHALGFSHNVATEIDPAGNTQTNIHIEGTAASSAAPSIMTPFVPSFPNCGTDFWGLQRDDILGAATVYRNK